MTEGKSVKDFEDWYVGYEIDGRDGCLSIRGGLSETGLALVRRYDDFKREMDARCGDFDKLERLADGQVVSEKPDLPNVSSGETAGIIRRMARNLVQHTPNVEIVSKFDDDKVRGIFAEYTLKSKIIGSDTYSNDMQQNLFASTKTSLTTGFACVVPILLQDAAGGWYIHYDAIHYRDVFPEPGAKDVRQATEVFVRRYLTRGEAVALVRNQTVGWDIAALKTMLKTAPLNREHQSNSANDKKRRTSAEGYEIITWYSSSGQEFLTFDGRSRNLLRIEKNKHPLKLHPVHFLVLEKDEQQPLGKSQVELLFGRQEFQDLMHNGAMKLWYRNINPSIIGYGGINTVPNLSPGKYTQVSNPNAKIEAFEVNTQTLMQYNTISQANLGSMVNLVGSADQQMAVQAGGGMSATPQGVEAQQAMVDITTNNYQKAIESFFSHYCSYALTLYFQELKGVKKVEVTADTRQALLGAGFDRALIDDNGILKIDFSELATEYFVKCVPGSLVEMEDEKQLRILNQLFVPLSQAMPALAATQDIEMLRKMSATMQFIVEREIELSGSNRSKDLQSILTTGKRSAEALDNDAFEEQLNGLDPMVGALAATASSLTQLQQQMQLMAQTQAVILERLGMGTTESPSGPNNPEEASSTGAESPATV